MVILGWAVIFFPARMPCCCHLPLSRQKHLLPYAFLGTVLALQGAYKKLWDESEPGTFFTHSSNIFWAC